MIIYIDRYNPELVEVSSKQTFTLYDGYETTEVKGTGEIQR